MNYRLRQMSLLAPMLIVAPALAQKASISGIISDTSMSPVAGADIQVINEQSSATSTAKSDSAGGYVFTGLAAGQYQVIVHAAGYSSVTHNGVTLAADQAIVQNLQLTVGSVESTVVVQGGADTYGVLNPPVSVQMGPAGAQKPLDSPYQTTVISQEVIRSQNLRDAAGFLEYDPSAQMSRSNNSGRPFTRGFESGVVENTRMDGLNIIITTGYPGEQFDRLEILDGVAGALYGPANPTGTFNYILKRPAYKPQFSLGYGYDALGVSTVYSDMGATKGRISGRLNIVYGDGQSYTSTSDYRRFLASGAVDIHLTPSTSIELNASYYDWRALGFPATFAYGSGKSTLLPSAPSGSRAGYGVRGAGMHNDTNTFSGRLLHDFNNSWHFTGGVLNQTAPRGIYQPTFTLTDNVGDYTATIPKSGAAKFTILSNQAYLNGTFTTGFIAHSVFIGTNGFSWNTYSASGTKVALGTGNLANPTLFAKQTRPAGQPLYITSNIYQQALVVGDTLNFATHWALSLNTAFSWLTSTNYAATGKVTGQYAVKGDWSPTVSLVYKPFPNQSAYISYSDSIIQGDTAPTTAANSGATLAPYRSRQYEAGYKYAVTPRLLLSAAGFRINKPFSYTDPSNLYRPEGMEVNWGSSFTATGQLTHSLSVIGGFQELVPTLNSTGNTATQGKDVVNVPRWQSNVLLEYKTPWVRNLEVSGNAHYTGSRAANDRNTTFADSYATLDIGAGYLVPVFSDRHALSARLDIFNITNTSYWQSIYPTSGTSLVGSSAVLGTPRIVSASLDYRF